MRFPKTRRKQTRTKTIIMTGGLNDIVTNLELKEGELHRVKNYMEMESAYHGYTSIAGYEAFDGKTNPSAIGVNQIEDSGIDDDTQFLLEAPSGSVDLAPYGYTIFDSGVGVQPTYTKFGDYAWEFASQYIRVGGVPGGAYSTAFSNDFQNVNIGTSTLNLGENWTIDFQYRPKTRTGVEVILEKEGCYKLSVDVTGVLTFELSEDGISYGISVNSGDLRASSSKFQHVSIRARNKVLQMAIGGVPATISGTPVTDTFVSPNQNEEQLYIGRSADGTSYTAMYFDEFRISTTYRWASQFVPPLERYTTQGYWVNNWDDGDREIQRAKITEVGSVANPATGTVLGVHIYGGEVYALRNLVAGGAGLFRANRISDGSGGYTDASGWVLVDTFPNQDGRLVAFNWRFSGSFNDQQVMAMVDGKNVPRIWDGTTMTVLDGTYAAGVASNLPDNQGTPRYAKTCASYDNRLMLGYEADDIFMSSSADPGDFSGGFGGQFLVGDDITNLVNLPKEAMAVICRNSIQVITQLPIEPSSGAAKDYWFKLDRYSREAGGYSHTAQRVLGRLLYCDDRGVIDFEATDKYTDFSQAAISKKVNRIYLDKKNNISCAMVDKEDNQYRVFFGDGASLWFTFQHDELKGATYIEYPIDANMVAQGEDPDGNLMKFFCTTDSDNLGYVFQMDSGTSFNGEAIETEMFTAFHHYASPRYWKNFFRVVFEITSGRGTEFNIRSVFDYDESRMPDTLWWDHTDAGVGGIWGESYYNTFAWGEGVVSRMITYIRGYGTNMSLELRTSSKYDIQHTIHNAIVDYEVLDPKE